MFNYMYNNLSCKIWENFKYQQVQDTGITLANEHFYTANVVDLNKYDTKFWALILSARQF